MSISDEVKRKKAQRTKDAERVRGFADFMDELVHDIEILECAPDFEAKHNEVVSEMKSNDKKQSSVDHDKKIEHMAKAVPKTKHTVYAAEEKNGMYIPAAVGGRVVLSLLCAKKEGHVDALQKRSRHAISSTASHWRI